MSFRYACFKHVFAATLSFTLSSTACSSSNEPAANAEPEADAGTAGSSVTAGAATGGVGGTAAGNAASEGGTTPSSLAGGGAATGGANAGGASIGGASTGGAGGSVPTLTTKDFECTEVIGLWVASQWWDSFEKGVDTAHWEFMFQHHGYLELFADPASPFWANEVSSKCTTADATPDRVVFLPFSLTLMTLDDWVKNLTQVVATMKAKYAGVKRIELMTTLRGPMNMPCANDTDPNTVVPAYVDQAIQMVADASGGLVAVGPKIELTSCDWWAGGTDLTGAGNTGAGQLLAQHYQTH